MDQESLYIWKDGSFLFLKKKKKRRRINGESLSISILLLQIKFTWVHKSEMKSNMQPLIFRLLWLKWLWVHKVFIFLENETNLAGIYLNIEWSKWKVMCKNAMVAWWSNPPLFPKRLDQRLLMNKWWPICVISCLIWTFIWKTKKANKFKSTSKEHAIKDSVYRASD